MGGDALYSCSNKNGAGVRSTILLSSLEDNDAGVHFQVVERAKFAFLNQSFELPQSVDLRRGRLTSSCRVVSA
jgi:hypothetical protein